LIFLAELLGGWWTGSLALLSDAAHVFLDMFALGLSYVALRLSALPPDDRHTYGYHRLEVLAALLNGVTLVGVSLGIFKEAWDRWQSPQEIKNLEMLVIATIGLVVNLVVAFVLNEHQHQPGEAPHRHRDLNVRSAFLHVVGDAVSSVGVILAAILIGYTGWQWIDPFTSVLIGLLILISSPEGITLKEIGQVMASTPGIAEIHDLHVWSLCSGHITLSAHAVLSETDALLPPYRYGMVMLELKRRLREQFGIEHTTIEIENRTPDSEIALQQII
jgi:cobalt-zinc-cadmium efflux system protein